MSRLLRVYKEEKWLWGFKPKLSMFVTCWILLTSSVILQTSKVFISADFYSLARSHQNDFPSWEQLGTSFVEILNWLLSLMLIIFKIVFFESWISSRSGTDVTSGIKQKGENLQSITLSFLCNVLPSTVSDHVSRGIPEEHQLYCVSKL